MKLILKKLHIQNFKGCKDRVVDFSSKTEIKGKNGSGKTTVADAVMWLLFGKNLDGLTGFDIRPKDATGTDIDFLDISVKAEFEVDGKTVEITKLQKQKWVTKRGCEEQTFQGNENKYEINTIPKTETEFKKYIEEMVPEEVFKFVSNTNAFMAQKALDRRKTLFKLVADLSDADVLATDIKLSKGLSDQLSKFTADEIMSRNKKALLEYKRKLEEIPSRIDEVSKTIVEVDYSESEKKLQELRQQLLSVDEGTTDSAVYDQINQLKSEISQYKGELQEIERNANSKLASDRRDVMSKINNIDQSITDLTSTVAATSKQIENIKAMISMNEKLLADLGNNYTAEKAKEMAAGTNLCPVCKQEYPEDMIDTMRMSFEDDKAKKLKKINLEGKGISDVTKTYKVQLEKYESELPGAQSKIEELKAERLKLQIELDDIPSAVDLTKDIKYQNISNSLLISEGNLVIASEAVKDTEAMKQVIINKKREIQNEIDAVNRILSGKQTITNAKLRVEELKAEQKQLSQDIATVEKENYLLEEFNKAKVNLLSEKINSHFKIVRWKLFERQINGGYNPICEPLVNGQAYSSALNSGHKILAELDIIQALQKIYEVSVPVFLDNAERINNFNIPEMDCQLITFSVTEDQELKVEAN